MTAGTSRYLSLHLPHLAAERLIRRRRGDGPAEAPFVTVAKAKGALRLDGLDKRAARLGLRKGQALADARAMYPALVVAEADPRAEARHLTDLVDWCRRWTPLCALDGADGAMLDVAGASHLFGGEAKLAEDAEARLARQGYTARAAVAATPEAAAALARFTDLRVAPEGKAFLRLADALPLAALRLEEATLAGLAQAGLRRIGDVRLRPRGPIAARFGAQVFDRLDALLGVTTSAISPRFEAPLYVAERRFAEPLTRQDAIEATLRKLAGDLAILLERHGEGARLIDADFFRVDGARKHVAAGASRPLVEPDAMARLFRERLAAIGEDGLDTGYGFDVIRLSARRVERMDAAQSALLEAPEREADMAELIDRLGARLGIRRVTRLLSNDAHAPEFAVIAAPAAHRRETRGSGAFPAPGAPDQLPTRPLRLFERPEPIEAIAEVPDGPPLRFRWRRVLREVAAIEGPERIADAWWRAPAPTRDYFRAEDREGRRYWLYREGLYGADAPTPRWFVHGVFA